MSETGKPLHPRKMEIVTAAVTCILERGYHQTGIRDIAHQAGISLGNLYNHFKGKDAVLAFIAELEGEDLSGFIERLSNPDDPRATLQQFITDYAAYVAQPENALLGIEILTEALRNPVIADAFEKNRSGLIDALVSCLTKGARSGQFTPYDDPRAIACLLLDALEGLGLRGLSRTAPDANAARSIGAFILKGLQA